MKNLILVNENMQNKSKPVKIINDKIRLLIQIIRVRF